MNINNILHNLGRYWFLILVVVLVVWGVIGDSGSSSTLPPPAPATAQVAPSTALPLPANIVSLSTGTVIKRVPTYLQGDGELNIDNGTGYDAVAKLIRNGTSVFTVYIKTGTKYTIKNISDGTYWLAFTQGINWDSTTKKFTNSNSSSSFDSTFDYETTDTQYTTYEITLNPVVGGTAETSSVNSDQFDAY